MIGIEQTHARGRGLLTGHVNWRSGTGKPIIPMDGTARPRTKSSAFLPTSAEERGTASGPWRKWNEYW